MHPTILLLVPIGASIAYALCLVIYRLYFHPFAKIPGPFLAKISYFHAFYHAWIKDTPLEQMRCHQKYGHVIRYTPNTLSFDQPTARHEIQGIGKNFAKGKSYKVVNPTPDMPPNITVQLDYKKHAQRKRIIKQAFSERALRQSQVFMRDHIETLCAVIAEMPLTNDDKKWTQSANFHRLAYWLAQDIMTDMTFGRSYNMLTDPSQRQIGDVMLASLDRNHLAFQYPGIFKAGLNKWLDFGTWFMPNSFNDIMAYLQNGAISTTERLESPPEVSDKRKDILSYLISARDPETGEGINKNEIIGEACILHLAGASTVAGAIALLFFNLTRPENADVQRKLAEELRTKFSSSDEITLEAVEHCPYLAATVFEAIRMTAGHAFWRDAQQGGATVTIPSHEADDAIPSNTSSEAVTYFIPEGYTAGFCDYANVRNPKVYPDPYTFDPDRWIPTSDFYTSRGFDKESARAVYERAKKATHTFGVGQRSCIAEGMANAMMLLVTGSLMWRFDMKKAEGPEGNLGGGGPGMGAGRERSGEFQWYGSFTQAGDGPMVHFKDVAGKS